MSAVLGVNEFAPSRAVIETVAAHQGVEPTDLEVPLFEAIDPDALDELLGADGREYAPPIEVEFTYDGYHVTVGSDGSIDVTPAV